MNLTKPEKLILLMLADMQTALEAKTEIDGEFVKKAIMGNQTWALDWEFSGALSDEDTSEETALEVAKLMNMWSFVETSF